MAVSLHNLRYKIAAAAVLKRTVRRITTLPGGRALTTRLIHQLQPEGESTGSYRGLAAGLFQQALETDSGGEALIYDPVAGLIPGAQPEEAADVARLQEQAEQDPSAAHYIALAAALRKSYVGEFARSAEAYEQAFAYNPHDLRAVEGILVSGARSHFDWPRIWRYASALKPRRGPLGVTSTVWDVVDRIFAQDPSDAEIANASLLLMHNTSQLPGLHQLLIETLSARLQFLGRFQAGAALREAMAQNRVNELRGIPLESALWLKHLLGAYAYLDDSARLTRTAARPPIDASGGSTARQVAKLRADVALWEGDAGPLQEHAAVRAREIQVPGESAMRRLVSGRRIAVVGPAVEDADYAEMIDAHDVVVRTNQRRPLAPEAAAKTGTRTDIAYYAGVDLTRHYDDVAALVEQGELKLAVTRPHCLPAFQPAPEWLRFPRFEFGLYFRGAPMGVQRILYDLLQFAPAQISLFTTDFYAGFRVTATGYREDAASFGPNSQANDPVIMHDLSFEFRLTQRMTQAGLVTPHGRAAEVLSMDITDYLRHLEHHSPLGRQQSH